MPQIKVWFDGCFDMMHYGHSNALRQARLLGTHLTVGVHSDEEILLNKGPPVMNEEERYLAVAACKWADVVVKDAPYLTTLETLDNFGCEFAVHGDDITTMKDGSDCYAIVKNAGRYKECKRTVGVSTTDLVGRMLLLTTDHHNRFETHDSIKELYLFIKLFQTPYVITPSQKVIYVDGGFDLFHIGHIRFLQKIRETEQFDHLLVGLHSDSVVNKVKGLNYPIMDLKERAMGVLSCRYVTDVILNANFNLNLDFINTNKINLVMSGKKEARHQHLIDIGKFKVVEIQGVVRSEDIVKRILDNRAVFEERNRRKAGKEEDIKKRF